MKTLKEINSLLSEKQYYYLFNRKNIEHKKARIKRIDFQKKENSELWTFFAVFDWTDWEYKTYLLTDELKYWISYIDLCMNYEKNNKIIWRLY